MENAEKLTRKIRTIFTGTESELNHEIGQFEARRAEKKIELDDKEVVLQTEQYEYSEISKKVDDQDRKYHSLVSERQRENELYTQKAKYMKHMCTKLNINVTFDIETCKERAANLVADIKTELGKIDGKIKEMIANNEQEDEKLEKEIRKYSDDGSRVEAELVQITNRLKELKSTLAQQIEELRKIERSNTKLEDVQKHIEKVQQKHEKLVGDANLQGKRAQIEEHRTEKQRLSEDLEGIDMQITELSTFAAILAEVNGKQKHLEKKESEANVLINQHRDSLQQLLPDESIEKGIKEKIETLNQQLRTTTNRLEAEIRFKENHVGVVKNQQQHIKKELNKLETEQRQLEEEIERECDSEPFDSVLASTKELVENHQMEYSTFKSSESFYKK